MFRQVKSAIFWYYIYKFRRRVALILTLLMLIFLSEYIYSDIVEYLQIRHKTEWLDFILPLKWIVIFGSIFTIFSLLLTMSQVSSTAIATKKKKQQQRKEKEEQPRKKLQPKKLSKKEVRELAQELIEKKRLMKS